LSTQKALQTLDKTLKVAVQERDAEAKNVATLRDQLRNLPSAEDIVALRAKHAHLTKQRQLWQTFETASRDLATVRPQHEASERTISECKTALEAAQKALSGCDDKLSKLAQQVQTVRQLLQAEHDLHTLASTVGSLNDHDDMPPVLQSKALAPVPLIVAHLSTRLHHYQTCYTAYAQDRTQASQFLQQSKTALARVKQSFHEQRGRHEALSQQCDELQRQLEDDHYREADLNHARLTQQIALYDRAIDDMKRYHRARADAIVRYHQETMTEINRILDELWKQSYQGGDIETIRIVSERRKNTHIYDYRVVMQMAGATEVQTKDMRAYASRGQQVLAALMIRFAFVRAFSLHTNLLVLDEPTTNLDAEHVRMLASTLNRIIAMHPRGTLQLVVITHNRAFVEQLCKSQHADYYYRLSRTPYTTVNKEPIRTL
jgi:DNA repair protein RAD50